MSDLYIGWDVGAWNCDSNPRSRDALCALEDGDDGLVVAGPAWRGNLRDLLVKDDGDALVRAILERVGVRWDGRRRVTIAIDTPLAWPRAMLGLVAQGTVVDVPLEADGNPYLFRQQERDLFESGWRPLSVVRDMIGSQSTKGIHFLRHAQLDATAVGEWGRGSVVAIETYPSVALKDRAVDDEVLRLRDDVLRREKAKRNEAWETDVRDAIACAVVAAMHGSRRGLLSAPDPARAGDEGWIWLPAGARSSRSRG